MLAFKILAPVLMLASTFARLIPLFVGATTGVSGLALAFGSLGAALAGVAGYWAGSEIWTHVLAGTKAGDAVGEAAAKVMASLGNKNAQDAVNQMNGRGPANHSGDFNASRTDWYKKKQADAIAYFQSQGFSRNAAIGMAVNIGRESAFDPHVTGDNGKAYGLGQWHPDRQANFAKFTGMPIQGSSYQQQLAFYAHEVKQNKRLMGMLSQQDITAPASAMAVSLINERPANGVIEAERRARMAQSVVTPYVGARATGSVVKAGSGAATNEVHINTINVQTKATDANGVAKGMQKAMRNNPLIAGSVTAAA
jgi:hypothetical protein